MPNSVKRELLQKVKEHLLKEAGYYDNELKKKTETAADESMS